VATPLNVRLVGGLRRAAALAAAPTDRQLLDRYVAGRDAGAFAELLRRHGPMVLGVCRRALGQAHDADDAFQLTFLALARRAGSVRGDGLAGWLHRVAARTARKAAARRRPFAPAADRPGPDDPMADIAWREVRRALDEELARLPARQRSALVLCYLDGRPRDEAARRLGLPLGTLKRDLERGRRALRERLAARGLAPAGLALAALAPDGLRAAVPAGLVAATLQAAGAVGPRRVIGGLLLLAAIGVGVGWFSLRAGERPAAAPPESHPAAPAAMVADEPLPPGAVFRLGTTRLRAAKLVAFLPDGRLLTARGDRVLLCDPETGRELRAFEGPKRLTAVVPSPDGKLLALVSDAEPVRLVEVAGGREVRRLGDEKTAACSAAFTPDGRSLVTGGADGAVGVWDVATGQELRRCASKVEGWTRVAVSPDGQMIASGHTDGLLRLWAPATGRELGRLGKPVKADDHAVYYGLTFAPDGRSVLAAQFGEGVVTRWDVATGNEVARYECPELMVRSITFSPDGKLLATGADSERGHNGFTVRLWDAATGKLQRVIAAEFGWGCFASMAFAPDGQTLAVVGEEDGTVNLYDVATGRNRTPSPGHTSGVSGLAFTPDGRSLVSVGLDRALCVWRPATGELRQRLPDALRPPPIISLAMRFTADGLLTGSGPDHAVRRWDLTAGRETWRRDIGDMGVVAVSPDGRLIAAVPRNLNGARCPIRLIEADTGRERPPLPAPGWAATALAFSPDGRTLAGSILDRDIDSRVALWDVATGRELRQWTWGGDMTLTLAWSPDGRRLATAGGGPVAHLWDAATGRELRSLKLPKGPIAPGLAFAPDGRTVAVASGPDGLAVWEVATGQQRRRLVGHLDVVNALSYSPDGRLLASGSHDTTILLWDVVAPDSARPRTELPALWESLGDADASRADAARRELVARGPAAVAFLAERLRPVPDVSPDRVGRLIADLGSDQYATRTRATADLEALAELAEPALRRALADQPTAELRRRAERLLARLDAPPPAGPLRDLRAVEALEQAGTPAARALLTKLAGGAEGAWVTRDARAAQARLRRE
jgi:RNA polymerase sigma factor (sigma-70 family)